MHPRHPPVPDPWNPLIGQLLTAARLQAFGQGQEGAQLERQFITEVNEHFRSGLVLPWGIAVWRDILSGRWGLIRNQGKLADFLGCDRGRISTGMRKGTLTTEILVFSLVTARQEPDCLPKIEPIRGEMVRSGYIDALRHGRAMLKNKVPFEFRVGKFYDDVFSKLTGEAYKREAITAINGVLGTYLQPAITIQDIDNKDGLTKRLIYAMQGKYFDGADKLKVFLEDTQKPERGLSDNNPLKTYKSQNKDVKKKAPFDPWEYELLFLMNEQFRTWWYPHHLEYTETERVSSAYRQFAGTLVRDVLGLPHLFPPDLPDEIKTAGQTQLQRLAHFTDDPAIYLESLFSGWEEAWLLTIYHLEHMREVIP